jgi:hypothetical protein
VDHLPRPATPLGEGRYKEHGWCGREGAVSVEQFLILGAGASFGARFGLGDAVPPLGSELAEYLLAWLDLNQPSPARVLEMENPLSAAAPSTELWSNSAADRLRDFLKSARGEPHGLGFERAADRLRQRNPDLLDPLNRLVAWSMLVGDGCRFPERRDRLDELLASPGVAQNVAVITLNYDVLLEEALHRAGRAYRYPGVRGTRDDREALPLFKLHGSINWLQLFSYAASADLRTAQEMARSQPAITISGPDAGPETQREYVPPGGRVNLILEMKHNGVARNPVLATYAPGKPVPYNYGCIDSVHTDCLAALAANPEASGVIIGVHLPTPGDDPRLDEVLQGIAFLRGGVEYVGPGTADQESAKSRGFTLGPRTLAEFLSAH